VRPDIWVRRFAKRLREQHKLYWSREDRLVAIAQFALVTIQLQNLAEQKEMSLV
jgi:hypothetical protein